MSNRLIQRKELPLSHVWWSTGGNAIRRAKWQCFVVLFGGLPRFLNELSAWMLVFVSRAGSLALGCRQKVEPSSLLQRVVGRRYLYVIDRFGRARWASGLLVETGGQCSTKNAKSGPGFVSWPCCFCSLLRQRTTYQDQARTGASSGDDQRGSQVDSRRLENAMKLMTAVLWYLGLLAWLGGDAPQCRRSGKR